MPTFPRFTRIANALPATVPFVGPEAIERNRHLTVKARIGANESGFGPAPSVIEAMRDAAARLINRNRLGRDVFARGNPEAVIVDRKSEYAASLYDLLTAYASQRQRQAISRVQIARRAVWSLKDARAVLERLVGAVSDWTALDRFLIDYLASPEERKTAIASTFVASLEMVREGALDIRQDEAYAPVFLRPRAIPRMRGEATHG